MAEPTTTTAAVVTLAAGSLAVPALTLFGVPLGLRPDLLFIGFAGSLAAISLLNSVPSLGDTWSALLRTTLRRMAVSLASALTAGYLTPMVLLLAQLPDYAVAGSAFLVGAGAQRVLLKYMSRVAPPEEVGGPSA